MHPQRQGSPLSSSARRRESTAASHPVSRHSSHEAFMGLGLMALMLSAISTSLEPSHSVGNSFGRTPPSFGEAHDPAASNPFPEYFRSSSSSGSGRFHSNFYRTLSPDDCGTCPVHDYAAINALMQAQLQLTARKSKKSNRAGEDDDEEDEVEVDVEDVVSLHSTVSSLDLAAASSDQSFNACGAPLDDSATGALTTTSPRDSDGDDDGSLRSQFATPRSLVLTPVPAVDKHQLMRATLAAVIGPHALERMTPSTLEQCERLTLALRRVRVATSVDESTAVVPVAAAKSVCFPSEGRVVCVPYTSAAWLSSAHLRASKLSQSPVKELQCDSAAQRNDTRTTEPSAAETVTVPAPQPCFRLFVGQLRKEVSVDFLQFLLHLMGIDVERDVAHVEMHTSAQGTRSKGCAWVDVRSEEAMARILSFHKRIFLNDSTMFGSDAEAGDGQKEFVVVAHEEEVEWLCQAAGVWSQAAGRSNDVLSRNPMVVEVPKVKTATASGKAPKTAAATGASPSQHGGSGTSQGVEAIAERSEEPSPRPAAALDNVAPISVAAGARAGAPAHFHTVSAADADGSRRMVEAEKLYAKHLGGELHSALVESPGQSVDLPAGMLRIGPATPPREVLTGFRAPWRFDPYHRTNARVFVAPEPVVDTVERCCATA